MNTTSASTRLRKTRNGVAGIEASASSTEFNLCGRIVGQGASPLNMPEIAADFNAGRGDFEESNRAFKGS
jgi:hypothetical protein